MNTQSTKKTSSMNRLLKGFIGLFLFVLSLVIVIPIGAFIFFNPSDYKTQVSEFITEKSGLPLEIKGDIKMRYFPWLGIHVEDVRLQQAQEFGKGDFISIETLEFKIPVSELFNRQLIVETLSIKGLNIQLIKTKTGASNWDYFSKQMKQKPSSSTHVATDRPNKTNSVEKPTKNEKKLSFALNHFEVLDAHLTLDDQEKQETISLSKLEFIGDAKLPKVIPVQGKFDLEQISSKTKSTHLAGHSDFKGTITVDKNLLANLDSTISLTFPENPSSWKKANVDLNINIDSTNNITLNNIRLHIGDLEVQGASTIPLNNNPITFNLKMNKLNVDQLMQQNTSEKKEVAQTAPAPATSSQIPVSTSNTTSASVNKSRAIHGEILIDKMIAKNLTLDNVKAIVKVDNSIIKIAPLTASLYQGNISVNVTKDIVNESAPTILQGTLSNVQIQPLLTDLNQEHRLTGSADVDFNLSKANQLTGITKVKIKNGTIRGIDVRYYLSVAQNLFNKDKNTLPDNKTTSFGDLSATLHIHDDMIDNNDLSIQSSDFKANGEGSVYLISKTIEYKIQAWRQYKDNKEHPNDYPLAIRIKGSLDHPKIEPDLDVYLKKSVEQEVKKELNKQIEKNIGKILGGGADKSPQEGQTQGQETDKSVQDQLQDKIEDKIDKGLKKLFKKKKEE
ncbi:MAG: AsmA family protein [Gammaproteobacteria bacterium]|nr:AsmA family protein [Gammaproteobacteria bacterium]